MYNCIRCEKNFNNKTDLERHINNTTQKCISKIKYSILTNEEEKILSMLKISERDCLLKNDDINDDDNICKFCYTSFNCKKYLTRHLKTCQLKDNYNYYKKLSIIYNNIKNNNINLLQIFEINSINIDFSDKHLSLNDRCSLLIRLDPIYVLENLFLDKKNINILPINDDMSCVIYLEETNEKKVKKINNELIKDVLLFKIKSYLTKLNNNLLNFKVIPHYSYIFYEEKIKFIFSPSNTKSILFEKLKNIIKKKNFNDLNYFYNPNLNFENFEQIKNYYENTEIDFINNLYGFEIDDVYDIYGNKTEFSIDGKRTLFDCIWKK